MEVVEHKCSGAEMIQKNPLILASRMDLPVEDVQITSPFFPALRVVTPRQI